MKRRIYTVVKRLVDEGRYPSRRVVLNGLNRRSNGFSSRETQYRLEVMAELGISIQDEHNHNSRT